MKILPVVFLIFSAVLMPSCSKKYTCACDGYEGLKSIKRYKYRSDNLTSANSTCQSYEIGTGGNLSCELE